MREDLADIHLELARVGAEVSRLHAALHDHPSRSQLELLHVSCRDAWRRLEHAQPGERDAAIRDVRVFVHRAEAVLHDLRPPGDSALQTRPKADP